MSTILNHLLTVFFLNLLGNADGTDHRLLSAWLREANELRMEGFSKTNLLHKVSPKRKIVWVLPKGQKSGLAGALEGQDGVASQN